MVKSDTVIIKDWPKGKHWRQKKGIDIKYELIDIRNKEWYATLFGSEKDNIYMEDINSELERMSHHLLSDRARTDKKRPRFKVTNGIKEVI